jgi:hypothetical protein
MALKAGLSSSKAMVLVGPPLFASVLASPGSVVLLEVDCSKPQLSSEML